MPERRSYHLVVSVAGTLAKPDRDLRGLVTLDDGTEATPHQARQWLRIQQMKGREVMPFGEPCEGFDYKTGCPGHPAIAEVVEAAHG